jgi:hypothetical protein
MSPRRHHAVALDVHDAHCGYVVFGEHRTEHGLSSARPRKPTDNSCRFRALIEKGAHATQGGL